MRTISCPGDCGAPVQCGELEACALSLRVHVVGIRSSGSMPPTLPRDQAIDGAGEG
jgi:hypothetical protein